jgi:hypothetical protein
MNYAYINYSDHGEKPVNFKELILDQAKRYALFQHLRDEHPKDYTFESFKHRYFGEEYYMAEVERHTERVQEYQMQLLQFETDEEFHRIQMEKQHWHMCGKYESMLQCMDKGATHSHQVKERLLQKKEKLMAIIVEWREYKTDNEDAQRFIQRLQEDASEMLQALDKEIEETSKSLKNSVASYKKYIADYKKLSLLDKEALIKKEMQEWIDHAQNDLKIAKQCLKRVKQEEEVIRIVFDSLNKVNKEI